MISTFHSILQFPLAIASMMLGVVLGMRGYARLKNGPDAVCTPKYFQIALALFFIANAIKQLNWSIAGAYISREYYLVAAQMAHDPVVPAFANAIALFAALWSLSILIRPHAGRWSAAVAALAAVSVTVLGMLSAGVI